MTRSNLHFWIAMTGGILVTIFASQTRFYISYVLRTLGIVLQEYLPIYEIIEIGHGMLRISVLQAAFYTLLIYSSIRLLSRIRKRIASA
jgi:hypothetical protein